MSTEFKNPDNIQTVDISRHRKLKIRSNPGYAHAKDMHVAAITLSELAECVSNFPVMFLKRPDDDRFMIAAMLGLRAGENVYYGPEFWESAYVPLVVRRHPFVIGYDDRLPNGDEITTCIDMSSPFLNESVGVALFNEDGEASDMLKGCHQLLNHMYESQKVVDQFIQKVTSLGLLVPVALMLQQPNGEIRNVAGLFQLDETKLKDLSAEHLRELHQEGYLAACYIIIGSVHQLTRMIRMRNQQGKDQIIDYRIEFDPKPPTAH